MNISAIRPLKQHISVAVAGEHNDLSDCLLAADIVKAAISLIGFHVLYPCAATLFVECPGTSIQAQIPISSLTKPGEDVEQGEEEAFGVTFSLQEICSQTAVKLQSFVAMRDGEEEGAIAEKEHMEKTLHLLKYIAAGCTADELSLQSSANFPRINFTLVDLAGRTTIKLKEDQHVSWEEKAVANALRSVKERKHWRTAGENVKLDGEVEWHEDDVYQGIITPSMALMFPPFCVMCAQEVFGEVEWCQQTITELSALKQKQVAEKELENFYICLECPNHSFCKAHAKRHQAQQRHHCREVAPFLPCAETTALNDALRERFTHFGAAPFLLQWKYWTSVGSREVVEPGEEHLCFSFRNLWLLALQIARRIGDYFLNGGGAQQVPRFVGIGLPDSILFVAVDVALAVLGLPSVPLERKVALCSFCVVEPANVPLQCIVVETISTRVISEGHHSPPVVVAVGDIFDSFAAAIRDGGEWTVLDEAFMEMEELFAEWSGRFLTDGDSTLLGLFPTSGSSNNAKMAMYSRRSIFARLVEAQPAEGQVELSIVAQYAPLTHFSARSSTWDAMFNGAARWIVPPGELFDAILYINPTSVFLVPHLWEELYRRYHRVNNEVGTGTNSNKAVEEVPCHPESIVGERCLVVTSGSAPTPPAVQKWIYTTFSEYCTVVDGYGSTEVGATIAVNGSVADDVEVELDENGKIWVKKENMFDGYYGQIGGQCCCAVDGEKEQLKSKHLLSGGFFCTGDIGEWQQSDGEAARKLVVVGRDSATLKMPNGKYCRCEKVEQLCEEMFGGRVVLQAFATVRNGSYVAVVCFAPLCKGGSAAEEELGGKIRDNLVASLALAQHEKPLAIKVLAEVPSNFCVTPSASVQQGSILLFSVENGLLTGSMKKKRKVIEEMLEPLFISIDQAIEVYLCGTLQSGDTSASIRIDKIKNILSCADSLQVAKFASILAAKLGISHQSAVQTLMNLAHMSTRNNKASGEADLLEADLRALFPLQGGATSRQEFEFQLKPDKHASGLECTPSAAQLERAGDFIVTGGTGHVGGMIVSHLLSLLRTENATNDTICIFCPVRCTFLDEGVNRLQQNVSKYSVCSAAFNTFEEHFARHVKVIPLIGVDVPCDGSRGWPSPDLIGTVIHAAAHVDFVQSYEQLRLPNVIFCCNLFEVYCNSDRQKEAKKKEPARFIHISTTSVEPLLHEVFQHVEAFEFPEELAAVVRRSGNGYAQSKAAAEMFLLAKSSKLHLQDQGRREVHNNNLCIVRLPFIWCQTETGASNISDTLSRYILSVLKSKKIIAVSKAWRKPRFCVLPVDKCSLLIFGVALNCFPSQQEAKVRALAPSIEIDYTSLLEAVICFDSSVQVISYDEWQLALKVNSDGEMDDILPLSFLFPPPPAQPVLLFEDSSGSGTQVVACPKDQLTRSIQYLTEVILKEANGAKQQ